MTAQDFEQWRKELQERYAPFQEFERREKERHDGFAKGVLEFNICKETSEQWHERVVVGMADEWDAACKDDQRKWYKNMSMFNGLRLWDSLTEEQQERSLDYRPHGLSKWQLIDDCKRYIEEEIEDFMFQYNNWHFEQYGWVALG